MVLVTGKNRNRPYMEESAPQLVQRIPTDYDQAMNSSGLTNTQEDNNHE